MMKLSTMAGMILTLKESKGKEAELLAGRWFAAPEAMTFIRVSANCVFRFEADGSPFFLRFNHADERSVEQIQAELAFVDAMADNGIRVARPIPSRSGAMVESLDTACGLLHAVMFEALAGRSWEELEELSPEMLMRSGRALGELHRAAQGYAASTARPSWRDHLALIDRYLAPRDDAARRELEVLQAQLEHMPITEENFGMIHLDFEQDNLIWDGETPGIIDFDGCAYYWFAADFAFALRDLWEGRASRVDLTNERFLAFLAGYREVRPIDQDEVNRIPLFARLHSLLTYAKLLRTLEDGVLELEPSWMAGLREKLVRHVERYREGFVELATSG